MWLKRGKAEKSKIKVLYGAEQHLWDVIITGDVPSRGHTAAAAMPCFNLEQAAVQLVPKHFSLVRLVWKHVRALECELAGRTVPQAEKLSGKMKLCVELPTQFLWQYSGNIDQLSLLRNTNTLLTNTLLTDTFIRLFDAWCCVLNQKTQQADLKT